MSSPGGSQRENLPGIRTVLREFFSPHPDGALFHPGPIDDSTVATPIVLPRLNITRSGSPLLLGPAASGVSSPPSREDNYQEPESSYLPHPFPSPRERRPAGSRTTFTDGIGRSSRHSPSHSSYVGPTRRPRRPSVADNRQPEAGPSREMSSRPQTVGGGSTGARRKFACPVCQKSFARPSSLTAHLTTHTGERPFTCPVPGCGRSYTVKSNMRRHMKSHRSEDYEVTEEPQFGPMDPLIDCTQAGGDTLLHSTAFATAGPSARVDEDGRMDVGRSILLSAPYPTRSKSP